MIEDIDKFLSDIDHDSEYSLYKEQELKNKEVEARKYDKNIGADINESETYRDRIVSFKNRDELKHFKDGYYESLKIHYDSVLKLKEYFSDIYLPEPVKQALSKYKYSFLRNIENVEKLYDQFIVNCNRENFQKSAKQDFQNYFSVEEITKNRLDFLVLKDIFLRLREFNSKVKKEWEFFEANFKVMALVNEVTDFYSKCVDIAFVVMSFCKNTDVYLEFIAAMLSIPKSDIDVLEKDISNKIFYRDDLLYDNQTLLEFTSVAKESSNNKETSAENKNDDDVIPHSFMSEPVRQEQQKSQFLRIPGHSTWNTKEPYILYIDYKKVAKEKSDLDRTIFFNDEIRKDPLVVAMVKRALVRFNHDKSTDASEKYFEFIFKFIIRKVEEITHNFALPSDFVSLFIYHIGPLTMFKIIQNEFRSSNLGLCFKVMDQNRISRFVPYEYIKDKVMTWFDENIHCLDLPFDKVQLFNEMKTLASEKFRKETELNYRKIEKAVEHYFLKTGKHLDKNELYSKKINELYKLTDIPIYMRFIDKTPFKNF